ncbi:MAG: AarF/UbiB family protein [Desulfosporosinus sp.]|nr:AarF/UbiB family protein [Desulfosporosinus sp.]
MFHVINSMPYELEEICRNILSDNYLITQDVIGRGSHGTVFDLPGGDLVIKLFNAKGIKGNYFDYIFLEALQGLESVPKLYAYAEKKFVVMEKIKGITLGDYYLNNRGFPLKVEELITRAISEFFERKIVLIDIKVDNHIYWIEDKKQIKFIDFGVCDDCSIMSEKFIQDFKAQTIMEIFEDMKRLKYELNNM